MPYNPNLDFKRELDLALDGLHLQIEALNYFNRYLPSTSQFLQRAKTKLNGRFLLLNLIKDDLAKLDLDMESLVKDGYPSSDFSSLLRAAFTEADTVIKNAQEAEALLKQVSQTMARTVRIIPGIPQDK